MQNVISRLRNIFNDGATFVSIMMFGGAVYSLSHLPTGGRPPILPAIGVLLSLLSAIGLWRREAWGRWFALACPSGKPA